jgi:hypothetical protein
MKLRRVARVLAVSMALAALGAPAVPHSDEARAATVSSSSVAPRAAIDIRGLFGDENEPDENEGGGEQAKQSSGTSLPVVLLLVAVAALTGAYLALRVRRLWLRLRDWGSDLRARLSDMRPRL